MESSQIYYRDFLQRCTDYGLTEVKAPPFKKVKSGDGEEAQGGDDGRRRMPDLAKMNVEREAKLARFRQSKQLQEEIKNLKAVLSGATSRY